MANTEVGSAFVSVYPKLSDDWSKIGDEAGTKMGSGFSTKTGAYAVAAGNLITKALGAAIDFVMDDLDEGIAKADTFNQFPRVMENLGFEASIAEQSIKDIMSHLKGLPTATQDLLPFVQALASTTHDLEQSTKFGLAFNDMLVANGASAGDASRAMEMFSKMLATGEYNTQRWESILAVIRPQLDQVAESMLGAGANAFDLGAALQSGSISFDELMDAVIRLDEEGGNSLASFHDQAKNSSKGIQTSVDNIHNSIQTGWQEIIEAIGEENITGFLDGIAQGFYSVMHGIAHFDEVCQGMYDTVEGVVFGIGDFFGGLFASIGEFFSGVYSGFEGFAQGLYDAVNGFVSGVGETVSGFFNGIYSGFSTFADGLYGAVSTAVDTIASVVGTVVDGIASNVTSVFQGLQDTVDGIWRGIQAFIEDPIGAAKDFVDQRIEDIVGFFTGLGERITNAIGDIHFPQPEIKWGEELNIAGINTGVRLPTIEWHKSGGYFDDPTLIGVGEAGGELLLPQKGGIMDPFADAVADRVNAGDDRIIAWLDDNLPYIIARYTPTVGQRDFDRMARRATA